MLLAQLRTDEDGQAMAEYGLIAAALLVGLALAVKGLQMALDRSLQTQGRALSNAP